MRLFFILIFFSLAKVTFSQEKLSKEFSLITENDLYVSPQKDRYYSNGLFFTYRYLNKNFKKLDKKIIEFQIGHQIFTPYKSTVVNINLHDRPFAAYLFGGFGITKVFKNKTLLKNNIQIGVVGKSAFGQELQEAIHEIYNFKTPNGWKYQIRNTVAINFNTEYYKALSNNKSNYLDSNFIGKISLGTIFNEAKIGVIGRIGFKKLQPLHNSIAFNTNLNNQATFNVNNIESFLYYQTSLSYIAFDATIEGSLFNDDSPVTYSPKAFRFDIEIGYKFTAKRWNFGYAYYFHTNKIDNLRNNNGNDYGGLFFSYLLH
tara:strand:- start:125 stop:1072 length:948 start_codon:yes stop_codon:yes gene_type:complete